MNEQNHTEKLNEHYTPNFFMNKNNLRSYIKVRTALHIQPKFIFDQSRPVVLMTSDSINELWGETGIWRGTIE